MISKTKILSIIIVLSMVMTGLTLVSWNVVAEDSNQPFLASEGYPETMIGEAVDQQQTAWDTAVFGIMQGGAVAFAAQQFQAATTGNMVKFSVFMALVLRY